ncbi:MAG: AraC-like DNA-binding protein [Bacteroidia bacterium]|jgi:AraC-like DNA-binding protein
MKTENQSTGLTKRLGKEFTAFRRTIFEPLMQLLAQELAVAGIRHPRPSGSSPEEFTHFYLEVVQLLQAQVAGSSDQVPMSRAEVELLCRCTLAATDLAHAIELCRRFCAMLLPRAGQLGLRVHGDSATFYLDSLRPETTSASNLVDITGLFAFRQLFQWLVGVDLPLRQVGIGAMRRDDVLAFLPLFRAPVLSGGKHYSLEFAKSALNLPVVRGRNEFPEFFAVFPCGVFDMTANELPQQVSALLYAAARQGGGIPTQREVASSLDIPFSTFRRRLADKGAAYLQLREDALRDIAQELLGRGEVAVNDIAAHLGFSDAAAFRRAFIRWQGESPSAWQQRE